MRKCGGYRWEITTFLEKLENSEFIRYGNIKVFENFANVLDIKISLKKEEILENWQMVYCVWGCGRNYPK